MKPHILSEIPPDAGECYHFFKYETHANLVQMAKTYLAIKSPDIYEAREYRGEIKNHIFSFEKALDHEMDVIEKTLTASHLDKFQAIPDALRSTKQSLVQDLLAIADSRPIMMSVERVEILPSTDNGPLRKVQATLGIRNCEMVLEEFSPQAQNVKAIFTMIDMFKEKHDRIKEIERKIQDFLDHCEHDRKRIREVEHALDAIDSKKDAHYHSLEKRLTELTTLITSTTHKIDEKKKTICRLAQELLDSVQNFKNGYPIETSEIFENRSYFKRHFIAPMVPIIKKKYIVEFWGHEGIRHLFVWNEDSLKNIFKIVQVGSVVSFAAFGIGLGVWYLLDKKTSVPPKDNSTHRMAYVDEYLKHPFFARYFTLTQINLLKNTEPRDFSSTYLKILSEIKQTKAFQDLYHTWPTKNLRLSLNAAKANVVLTVPDELITQVHGLDSTAKLGVEVNSSLSRNKRFFLKSANERKIEIPTELICEPNVSVTYITTIPLPGIADFSIISPRVAIEQFIIPLGLCDQNMLGKSEIIKNLDHPFLNRYLTSAQKEQLGRISNESTLTKVLGQLLFSIDKEKFNNDLLAIKEKTGSYNVTVIPSERSILLSYSPLAFSEYRKYFGERTQFHLEVENKDGVKKFTDVSGVKLSIADVCSESVKGTSAVKVRLPYKMDYQFFSKIDLSKIKTALSEHGICGKSR
ncbi:MAG: hypothetical protein HYV97_20100 [Bdellovibrio sp.]|nr:hypothetical protein [Bdellovibrio sp.]